MKSLDTDRNTALLSNDLLLYYWSFPMFILSPLYWLSSLAAKVMCWRVSSKMMSHWGSKVKGLLMVCFTAMGILDVFLHSLSSAFLLGALTVILLVYFIVTPSFNSQKKTKGSSRTQTTSCAGEPATVGPERTLQNIAGGEKVIELCCRYSSPGSFLALVSLMCVKIWSYSVFLSHPRNMDQSSRFIWVQTKWWS